MSVSINKRESCCRKGASRRPFHSAGFTLLEVVLASFVMVMALSTSLLAIQKSIRAIDTARDTAIAGQVLQSFTEDLRTRTWAQISSTTITGAITNGTIADFDLDQVNHPQSQSFLTAGPTAAAVLNRYKFSRTVTNVPGTSNTMKAITLSATWNGIDGRSHTISTTSYYAQYGLYAYYST